MTVEAKNPNFHCWQARDPGEADCSSSPKAWETGDILVQVKRLEKI